jgi:plasmid maintenance system antidote protein VapI
MPKKSVIKDPFSQVAIGIAIDANLERLGWTKDQLAKRLDLDPSKVTRLTQGVHAKLPFELAIRMADAFGITAQEFVDQATRIEKSGLAERVTDARARLRVAQGQIKELAQGLNK